MIKLILYNCTGYDDIWLEVNPDRLNGRTYDLTGRVYKATDEQMSFSKAIFDKRNFDIELNASRSARSARPLSQPWD